jgi:hypothetical protein
VRISLSRSVIVAIHHMLNRFLPGSLDPRR